MSIKAAIDFLCSLQKRKCGRCGATLIIQETNKAVIKNRLLIASKSKGDIEIKCRECGTPQIIGR